MTAHVTHFESQVSLMERRRDVRLVTTYRAARIVTEQGQQQLGIIRNISVGGVMIETHAVVVLGERIWIEPRGCEAVWGTIVWSDRLRHGVAFDSELPGESLLELTIPEAPNQVVRAPRIAVDTAARLCVAGIWRTVRICDLSQGGAKLDCAAVLAEADPAVLCVPGLGNIEAFVRWQRKGKVGLLFAEPLSVGTLSAWLVLRGPRPAHRGLAQLHDQAMPDEDEGSC